MDSSPPDVVPPTSYEEITLVITTMMFSIVRSFVHIFPLLVFLMLFPNDTWGKVLHTREEVPTLAFPDAEHTEIQRLALSEEDQKQVTTLAKTKLESPHITYYVGYKNEKLLGYAFLETLTIRTLPGAFLVVVSPAGIVKKVMVLAFHEPEDYLPTERWLRQFEQKSLNHPPQLHHGIHGIAGATLSSQAATSAVRLSLALFQFLQDKK